MAALVLTAIPVEIIIPLVIPKVVLPPANVPKAVASPWFVSDITLIVLPLPRRAARKVAASALPVTVIFCVKAELEKIRIRARWLHTKEKNLL